MWAIDDSNQMCIDWSGSDRISLQVENHTTKLLLLLLNSISHDAPAVWFPLQAEIWTAVSFITYWSGNLSSVLLESLLSFIAF